MSIINCCLVYILFLDIVAIVRSLVKSRRKLLFPTLIEGYRLSSKPHFNFGIDFLIIVKVFPSKILSGGIGGSISNSLRSWIAGLGSLWTFVLLLEKAPQNFDTKTEAISLWISTGSLSFGRRKHVTQRISHLYGTLNWRIHYLSMVDGAESQYK